MYINRVRGVHCAHVCVHIVIDHVNLVYMHVHVYHVAENFRGRKLSQIGGEQEISRRKLSWIAWRHQLGVGVAVDFRRENFRG